MFRGFKHEYYGRSSRHRRKKVVQILRWAKLRWPAFGWTYCWPDRSADKLAGGDRRWIMRWPERKGANIGVGSN